MPSNRRTFPPRPLPATTTTTLTNLKQRLVETSRVYRTENCDEKGNILNNNITREEREGLKSIQGKVREQEWIVMPSDKSGRLTATSKEHYLERIQPHMVGDREVTVEERHKLEEEMNATTLQWGRMLRKEP